MDDVAAVIRPHTANREQDWLNYDERMCLLLNTAVGIPGLRG
jgi:hypothetical protein